ncbi:carboxypeptidase SOL1-like [Malus sylvestris]|uniref:carboxypeptidase SOL1-like n=1 Tax=Malus sylvestris TaxID=3752 RepID=UPI0021AC97B2|nr:carboxypeptidase SOL1-like [Malus sylvestris]
MRPGISYLLTLWGCNKMSMLNLVATVAKIGVHGRIFSSDGARPLPGFIAIKGINSKVQASRAIVDYHSLLAPAGRYKVTATAPGYKSKTTCIWLEEAGTTNGDFVLNPEVNPRGI